MFQEARNKGYKMKKSKWFDEINQNLVALDKKEQIN